MNIDNSRNIMIWIWLANVINLGQGRLWQLVDKFGSAENVCKAATEGHPDFTEDEKKRASRTHSAQIKGIISYCLSHNIGIMCIEDEEYPPSLKKTFNPPPVLYYRGRAEILSDDIVLAVVGARSISVYSERVTQAVAATAARNGITIASGFAVGTDITAHLAAVRNGGKTIAVLGCGIDYDYPEVNMQYKEEILENGIFISTYMPQTAAKPIYFPERNRILTGLAIGTAVIEASKKSGSLNSASHAISHGRDLWVVPPHDILDQRYEGNKILLHDGAMPICSPDDIVEEYFENYSHKPVRENIIDFVSLDNIDNFEEMPKPKKHNTVTAREIEKEVKPKFEPTLEENEKIIYDILKNSSSPISADEVAALSEMDIAEVLSIITDMEIEGIISSDAAQNYYI